MASKVKPETDVVLLSWNVRGLNNMRKCKQVTSYLQRQHVDVAFLQETHLAVNTRSHVVSTWGECRYLANYSAYARGVAILIHKRLPFVEEEVYRDRDGRYVMVKGRMLEHSVLFVNVYAPNVEDPDFFNNIHSHIIRMGADQIYLGGDLNLLLDPELDSTSHTTDTKPCARRAMLDMIEQLDSVDAWRTFSTHTKGYTHYSAPHNTWTRLDDWCLSAAAAVWLQDVTHMPRTLSDHSPVLVQLRVPRAGGVERTWRFPDLALQDPVFAAELREAIEEYFALNTGSVDSVATLWEAFKAYTRGICISKSAGVLRSLRGTLAQIETRLRELDEGAAGQDSPDLHTQAALLAEFREAADREVNFLGQNAMAHRYGEGERPGRTLARILKHTRRPTYIAELNDESGKLIPGNVEILREVLKYYITLYTTRSNTTPAQCQSYVDEVPHARMTKAHQEFLAEPFNEEEVLAAIEALDGAKAPGLDGYTGCFYKKYNDLLVPHLIDLYQEAIERGTLPLTLREAVIILIPKPGKDWRNCSSYRPLSLLYFNNKILAKVLATRLALTVEELILPAQSGFIPHKFTALNTRTLFTTLNRISPTVPAAAVLLDAEKAFDSLEWSFLYTILHAIGTPERYIAVVQLLYIQPTACIRLNGTVTRPFPLTRGTRQGCPLSPLLFILVLDPLVRQPLHKHRGRGLHFKTGPLLLTLYADNIILYVGYPDTNLQPLLREVTRYDGPIWLTH